VQNTVLSSETEYEYEAVSREALNDSDDDSKMVHRNYSKAIRMPSSNISKQVPIKDILSFQ